MMIDPDTARNLELVGNMSYKKSTHSLFGYINLGILAFTLTFSRRTVNHTYTAMASRLLRVNILSPITGMRFLLVLNLNDATSPKHDRCSP
jgi:DNA mismatch repair protein MSH4